MKQYPNRYLLFLFFLCAITFTYAQDLSTVRIQEEYKWQLKVKKVVDLTTPTLFSDKYLLAELSEPNGRVITGKKFKLDLKDSKLYYLDSANEIMEVISPVKTITFLSQEGNEANVLFAKGFPSVDKLTMDNFYQVLVSGKASLLLDTKFIEVERTDYGGAPTKRTDKLLNYYGASGAYTMRLAKPESIETLLSDKSKEIADYMRRENIKVKKQSDLVKVFTYYNSLFK